MLKNIYSWVIGLANRRYSASALFLLAFAESSIFPIPPDILLMPLCLGNRKKALYYASLCTMGSVLGGIAGYLIGHLLWWNQGEFTGIAQFFFTHIPGFTVEKFGDLQSLYEKFNFWIVFTAGFTPLPYKVITISAGAFNLFFPMFLVASLVGRGARFYLIALLLAKYGDKVRDFIEKYFNLLAILFVLLLVGGFALLKLI